MKRFMMLILFVTLILISGDKKEKPEQIYIKRTDRLKMIESRADALQKSRKVCLDSVATIDKEMTFLQGAYAVYVAMPDSFVARQDTAQNSK